MFWKFAAVLSLFILASCSTPNSAIVKPPSDPLDKTDHSNLNLVGERLGIDYFYSNHQTLEETPSVGLNFRASKGTQGLWLVLGQNRIDLSTLSRYQLPLSQASHVRLDAVDGDDVVSSSLSFPQKRRDLQGDYYHLPLADSDIARLPSLTAQGETRFRLTTNLSSQQELVVIALNVLDSQQPQQVQVSYQGQLQPSHHPSGEFSQELVQHPEYSEHLDLSEAALDSHLPKQLNRQSVDDCLGSQLGQVCSFAIYSQNQTTQTYQDELRSFRLAHVYKGMRFFVDAVDTFTLPLATYGDCASQMFNLMLQDGYQDIDQSGGITFVLSSELAYNGQVRWTDMSKMDVAYLNSNHMKHVQSLSLATLYEEFFHVYHLAYRAKRQLAKPERFEAESLIGAVLSDIKQSGMSRACGGMTSGLELASSSLSMADLFMQNPQERFFLSHALNNDMFEYGVGRLIVSIIQQRQPGFAQSVLTSPETGMATWQKAADHSRSLEDALLSLVLSGEHGFKGYEVPASLYQKRDIGYDVRRSLERSQLSLTTVAELENKSFALLTARGSGGEVGLELTLNQGSLLVFIRDAR